MPRLKASLQRNGFTLIELLVTLVVVAILAAILIPAVVSVREKAASSQSASNLRQLGGALLMFSNEHNGHFPPVAIQTKSEEGTWENLGSWDSYLLPYVGVDVPSHGALSREAQIKPVGALFSHPADESVITLAGGIRRGYSMPSGDGMIGKATWTGTGWFPSESNFSIADPAATLLLVEKAGYPNNIIGRTGIAGAKSPEEQLAYQPDLNPGGGFNYLFADGHVEFLAPEATVGEGSMSDPEGFWTLDPSD